MCCLTRAQASAKQVLQPCAAVKRSNDHSHSRAGVPVARQLILAGADIGKKNKVLAPLPLAPFMPRNNPPQMRRLSLAQLANHTFASLNPMISHSKDLNA
jgi:hypothetical protein